jgi:glycerophosphoryl diester phosphodiesterase
MSWLRRGATPLVIAHRGASAACMENTMAAFERARADGADGVELDVRLCASGELVVFHDEDLMRLAQRPVTIEEMKLGEVRAIRLTSGDAIPLLDEVLEALGESMCVNVEIKTTRRTRVSASRAVARALARHHGRDRLLVSSFDPAALGVVRATAPKVAVGLLFHGKLALPLRRAWAARVLRPVSMHPHHALVRRVSMQRWHEAGLAVLTWTVDEPAEVARVARLGVDGIITNDPAATRGYLG